MILDNLKTLVTKKIIIFLTKEDEEDKVLLQIIASGNFIHLSLCIDLLTLTRGPSEECLICCPSTTLSALMKPCLGLGSAAKYCSMDT